MWLDLHNTLTKRLDHIDQITEEVFLDMGGRLGDIVKNCKDVIEMTHQATIAFSDYETIHAAKLSGDQGISDLLSNLDDKISPMAEKVMVMSETMANRVNMIVEAVQFQDITRQEIDRVRKTFGNLSERADQVPDGKKAAAEETVTFLIDVIGICDIQSRRIEAVARQISDAWSGIHKGLIESDDEILRVAIIMSSLAQLVQEVPCEMEKQKILSTSRVVEEKARSLSLEIGEMKSVFADDQNIPCTLENMIRDLNGMAAFSRTAASCLLPDGHEMTAWTDAEPGSISRREDTRIEEEQDDESGSVELF